jgi:hydroxymethylpyrimidine pyrophosphatase-like HAD family hydrolase
MQKAGMWAMVVRASGYSKGTALVWLARHHGITPEEVVAVGDWFNDVPMFEAAGRSFVMAQAPEDVKQTATDRLDSDSSTGGGIAEAALRAGLL